MQLSHDQSNGSPAANTDQKCPSRHKLAVVLVCGSFARFAVVASPVTVWDYSPVGECSGNYVLPKPTADDSMVVQPLRHRDVHANAYVWFWDPTPSRNQTRQLARMTPNKVGCTILFMPNSDQHDFHLTRRGNLPEKIVAASATMNNAEDGGHYFEYEYSLDKRNGLYRKMPDCLKVSVPGQVRKRVSCREAAGE